MSTTRIKLVDIKSLSWDLIPNIVNSLKRESYKTIRTVGKEIVVSCDKYSSWVFLTHSTGLMNIIELPVAIYDFLDIISDIDERHNIKMKLIYGHKDPEYMICRCCSGKGKIELFSFWEDPCKTCMGSGKEQC